MVDVFTAIDRSRALDLSVGVISVPKMRTTREIDPIIDFSPAREAKREAEIRQEKRIIKEAKAGFERQRTTIEKQRTKEKSFRRERVATKAKKALLSTVPSFRRTAFRGGAPAREQFHNPFVEGRVRNPFVPDLQNPFLR